MASKGNKTTATSMEINEKDADVIIECMEIVADEGLLSKSMAEFSTRIRTTFFPNKKKYWWERVELDKD